MAHNATQHFFSWLPRWLILSVLVVNLALIGIAAQGLYSSRAKTVQHVSDTAMNLAILAGTNFVEATRRVDFALLDVTDSLQAVRTPDLHSVAITRVVEAQRRRHPEIISLRVHSLPGQTVAGPASAAQAADATGPMTISEPVQDAAHGDWRVLYRRTCRLADGHQAEVVAAVPVTYFKALLAGLELDRHGSAVIRHTGHALLTRHPAAPGPGGQVGNRTISPEFDAFLASGQKRGMFHTPRAPDGYERTYASLRIGNMPYVLNVGMSPQDYLTDWQREVRITAGLLAGFMGLSLLGLWLFRRYWQGRAQDAEALMASEMRFRTYVESAPEGIFVASPDGRYTEANEAACALVGRSRSELLTLSIADLTPPGDEAEHQAVMQNLLARGILDAEIRLLCKDGSTVYIALRTRLLPDGQIIGYCSDISGRKAAEAELAQHRRHLEALVAERTADLSQAKEVAEAASRAKSTFLANMSHELRTPMSAILGMTEVILRSPLDDKLRDQMGKVRQASTHLLHVINDILDISKIEASQLHLEHTPFHVGEVIENLISLVGQRADAKGLGIHVRLPPGLPGRTLIGDPLRLGQILLNLTGNAIKFTDTGTVTLSARITEEAAPALTVRWEVTDTGIGIAAADQARIFEAFEQADDSMTRRYGGTGLGLVICKRLVHMMGGEIGVTSTPGAGSTFWFTVRLESSEEEQAEAEADQSGGRAELALRARHAGVRVLLADDEPINREVSRILLEEVGLHVDQAEDGADAVSQAHAHRYGLILMDMQMPRMNGIDATRAIRSQSLNTDTPILAMTANAFEEDRQACLAAGMNDHIAKPIQPDALYAVLLAWLDRRPAAAG